jgi:hypothetical protein
VTGYRLSDGVGFLAKAEIFLFFTASRSSYSESCPIVTATYIP